MNTWETLTLMLVLQSLYFAHETYTVTDDGVVGLYRITSDGIVTVTLTD